jgi:hypothetical protein
MGVRFVAAVVLTSLLVALPGCNRETAGSAHTDPRSPGTALSKDGFGIVAGNPDAPARIEVFTNTSCRHCVDLQTDFGKQLASQIDMGRLAVTYRPLVIRDGEAAERSRRIANSLFLSVGPDTSGPAFQTFVQALSGYDGASNSEIAAIAATSGVGAAEVKKIADGTTAVDVVDMSDTNYQFLFEVDALEAAIPTVYDLVKDDKLDIYNNNWLSKLMAAT